MIQFLNNLTERMRANTEARRQRIDARMQGIRDTNEARKQYSAYHQQQREGGNDQQFSGQVPPAPPNQWAEKTERLRTERAARIGAHNNQPQSKTAKRINLFIAPVSAVGGLIITNTNTWPTIPIRKFITDMGVKSELLVFLPIGLAILLLASIVAAAVARKLEKNSEDQQF